jgi:hypothetical protein
VLKIAKKENAKGAVVEPKVSQHVVDEIAKIKIEKADKSLPPADMMAEEPSFVDEFFTKNRFREPKKSFQMVSQ